MKYCEDNMISKLYAVYIQAHPHTCKHLFYCISLLAHELQGYPASLILYIHLLRTS